MAARGDYCCCAIPIFNFGIYLAILANLTLAITAGALAVGTPSIVSAATPSFASWVFGIVCFVAAGVQVLGILAVMKEKPTLFKRYSTLNWILVAACFSVAAAWIGWSGAKHDTAETNCENNFFANSNTTQGQSSALVNLSGEGQLLCNIFVWVTWGVGAALWVALAIFEIYLIVVISSYGSNQRDDHAKYFSTYSVNDGARPDDMLMGDRSADGPAWNSRMSMDSVDVVPVERNNHYRTDSSSTVRDEKPYSDQPDPEGGYKYAAQYPQYRSNTIQSRATRQASADYNNNNNNNNNNNTNNAYNYPSNPVNAYTQDPGPTPTYTQGYYPNTGYTSYPQSQSHPALGSFGRKTPRNEWGGEGGTGNGKYY